MEVRGEETWRGEKFHQVWTIFVKFNFSILSHNKNWKSVFSCCSWSYNNHQEEILAYRTWCATSLLRCKVITSFNLTSEFQSQTTSPHTHISWVFSWDDWTFLWGCLSPFPKTLLHHGLVLLPGWAELCQQHLKSCINSWSHPTQTNENF